MWKNAIWYCTDIENNWNTITGASMPVTSNRSYGFIRAHTLQGKSRAWRESNRSGRRRKLAAAFGGDQCFLSGRCISHTSESFMVYNF